MCVVGDKPLAASWSETGKVFLWDLTHPLKAVNDPVLLKNYVVLWGTGAEPQIESAESAIIRKAKHCSIYLT